MSISPKCSVIPPGESILHSLREIKKTFYQEKKHLFMMLREFQQQNVSNIYFIAAGNVKQEKLKQQESEQNYKYFEAWKPRKNNNGGRGQNCVPVE